MVGEAVSGEDAAHLAAELMPAVVVAAGSWAHEEELASLCEALDHLATPAVLVAAEVDARPQGAAWPAGLAGALLADATAAQVVAALRAAAQGLVVLDPAFASILRRGPGRAAALGATDEPLTDREREVLDLVSLGLANKAIAARLGISDHTVKFHLGSIFAKLGVESRTEAVTVAARRGLIAL